MARDTATHDLRPRHSADRVSRRAVIAFSTPAVALAGFAVTALQGPVSAGRRYADSDEGPDIPDGAELTEARKAYYRSARI